MDKFTVTFYPDNLTVEVAKDTTILTAAISAGVYINSACGGDGVCGRCKVIVKKGNVLSQPSGAVSVKEKERHIYLACLTTVHGDTEVEIPPESRMELTAEAGKIYSQVEEIEAKTALVKDKLFKHLPLTEKLFLNIPEPNRDDAISDLERLYREIEDAKGMPVIQTGLANIKQLGELLRDSQWKVTVTLAKKSEAIEVILIEPGDKSGKNFGLSLDIGTTTISGQLVDLNSGKTLGTKASYNKQATFGPDVISRIIHARNEEGLEQLHKAVTETINQIIKELTHEHGVDLNDLTCISCAGNTTMIHLLLRIDPTYIRKQPYVPTANFIPVLKASEAGLNINPRGILSCVPGVASYVGGDTTAGVLSSGLYREKDLSILIDIGTNGEIALGNSEFIVACAASAGPAFEGSGVSSGMRASQGAIEKIKVDPKTLEVKYSTIGSVKARGICGSGYIEAIGALLSSGVIDKNGKIGIQNHKRVRAGDQGKEFVLVFKEDADSSTDIVITEADIENLKRAKAAIYSASAILVKHMEFEIDEIKKVFIAGGFGTSLNVDSAVKIGLLPDLDRKRFFFIGNSSLAGARAALLSNQAARETEELARKITYFELSVDPGYMDEYMAALFFPHTDLKKFPTVTF